MGFSNFKLHSQFPSPVKETNENLRKSRIYSAAVPQQIENKKFGSNFFFSEPFEENVTLKCCSLNVGLNCIEGWTKSEDDEDISLR